MRSSIIIFLLFVSTIVLLPLSFSQVDDRVCPASAACEEPFDPSQLTNVMPDFAHLGFNEESMSIPASGSTIVVGPGEELFILAEEQIIITLGEPGEDLMFRGIVPGRRINQLELPVVGVGETMLVELTMLEGEDVDQVANCLSLQNHIEGLRKNIGERNSDIVDLRNQPGNFQNQTIQSLIIKMQNDNDRDRELLPTLDAQFEILQCDRVPRDEQERPEARPTDLVAESFQRSHILVVGEGSPSGFIPNYQLTGSNLYMEKSETLELAILEPTDGFHIISGSYGAIEYPSVISPGSEYIIRYNNTVDDFDPSGESIEFVLETTRKLRIDSHTADLTTSIEKNGTIASTTLNLPNTQTGYFQINIPEIGESENGDSPLQYGLHFFHVHSNFVGIGTLDAYLPVYVVPSGEYNLVGYSLASEPDLRINLADYVPNTPELFIISKSNDVTTFIESQEINIPVAVISVSDNLGPINLYEIILDADFITSYSDGKTYILANSATDTFSISNLKIFNFIINDFTIIDSIDKTKTYQNKLGFPNNLDLILDINTIDISVFDEFEQPFIDGQIVIQKADEEFTTDLLDIPRLKLPDGNYKITHIVEDEIKSEQDISISSSGLIQFNVKTLTLEDQILTIAIIIESILIAFFTFRIMAKYFKG
ncbi:MAG: hypothetical protein HS049_01370 [Thaumarchaeota archaeon]|nr:hypothetical protein [Nitrososphaerota archaeon]